MKSKYRIRVLIFSRSSREKNKTGQKTYYSINIKHLGNTERATYRLVNNVILINFRGVFYPVHRANELTILMDCKDEYYFESNFHGNVHPFIFLDESVKLDVFPDMVNQNDSSIDFLFSNINIGNVSKGVMGRYLFLTISKSTSPYGVYYSIDHHINRDCLWRREDSDLPYFKYKHRLHNIYLGYDIALIQLVSNYGVSKRFCTSLMKDGQVYIDEIDQSMNFIIKNR